MFKVTFRFENGETVEGFAAAPVAVACDIYFVRRCAHLTVPDKNLRTEYCL